MEKVRMRKGMYIGGKEEKEMKKMFEEVIENQMEEEVDGKENLIEVKVDKEGFVKV